MDRRYFKTLDPSSFPGIQHTIYLVEEDDGKKKALFRMLHVIYEMTRDSEVEYCNPTLPRTRRIG